MGMLSLLGYSLDPMNILTPFLIFAIGVSHGVQKISAWIVEKKFHGRTPDDWAREGVTDLDQIPHRSSMHASRETVKKLLAPGIIALVSDTIGFLTILFIEIRIIQELAITASIGVAVIILTNLILLPVLLSVALLLLNPSVGRIAAAVFAALSTATFAQTARQDTGASQSSQTNPTQIVEPSAATGVQSDAQLRGNHNTIYMDSRATTNQSTTASQGTASTHGAPLGNDEVQAVRRSTSSVYSYGTMASAPSGTGASIPGTRRKSSFAKAS